MLANVPPPPLLVEIEMALEVADPALPVAEAVMECDPSALVVESHAYEKGADESVLTLAPSTRNVTLEAPGGAAAVSVTEPAQLEVQEAAAVTVALLKPQPATVESQIAPPTATAAVPVVRTPILMRVHARI
jgi:hypothetical protein